MISRSFTCPSLTGASLLVLSPMIVFWLCTTIPLRCIVLHIPLSVCVYHVFIIHMYTYIHIYTNTHDYTCIYTQLYTCILWYVCVYIHIYIIHTHICHIFLLVWKLHSSGFFYGCVCPPVWGGVSALGRGRGKGWEDNPVAVQLVEGISLW